ncbi:hypothetical protein GCM10028862_01820 [Luteimonas pelagia]
MAFDVLAQGGGSVLEFGSVLQDLAANPRLDATRVAAAYVTVSGVRSLMDAARETNVLNSSLWVVGLDDALTQPGAIESLAALDNSEVRVAGVRYSGLRFHPKFFQFSDSSTGAGGLLLGSANLTKAAFRSNVEAGIKITYEDGETIAQIQSAWAVLWNSGVALTSEILERYKEEYRESRANREAVARETGKRVLDDDEGTVDPALATTCWIEVGNITGFQAEQLEIKAEQALFFGVGAHGGPDKVVPLRLQSGAIVDVRLTYLGNYMWRFYLPPTIPEVADRGLRPDGKRSPYVAVFSRVAADAQIDLRFLQVNSPEIQGIRTVSLAAGTMGRTTAREYGWY